MESSLSSNQVTPTAASEALSLAFLLKRGIDCTRQGSYVEGAAFFVLARERLTPDQMHLAIVLDAFLQSHSSYWQAQQSLHFASKRFAAADSEHQTCLLAIEKLLPPLDDKAEQGAQSQLSQPLDDQLQHQQPRLHLLSTDYKRSDFTIVGSSAQEFLHDAGDPLPDLYITCFGHFGVKRSEQPIVLCHSRNGQAILRYLVAQTGYRATVDRLMDALWPQDAPEIARRKLQVAASAARRSLNGGYHCGPGEGYILCRDGFYEFNPLVTIHTDVDEFLSLWQAGRQAIDAESIALYERACNLCSGPFLVEDTYADWSSTRREQLKQNYFSMCRALAGYYLEVRHYEDAVKWTSAILREDRCHEAAHRQLIRIYVAQGCRSEALQQYYRCERILSQELGVQPMSETMDLLQVILNSPDLPLRAKLPTE
jgi:DNA-binding SARP family transcriptional activator